MLFSDSSFLLSNLSILLPLRLIVLKKTPFFKIFRKITSAAIPDADVLNLPETHPHNSMPLPHQKRPEIKSTFWFPVIISCNRRDHADQILKHLLRFSQSFLILRLCRNVIPVMKTNTQHTPVLSDTLLSLSRKTHPTVHSFFNPQSQIPISS